MYFHNKIDLEKSGSLCATTNPLALVHYNLDCETSEQNSDESVESRSPVTQKMSQTKSATPLSYHARHVFQPSKEGTHVRLPRQARWVFR